MATAIIARPQSFDRQWSLLHLDCSADLRLYSRNLGPGVQEKIFQQTSDALRAQLDEHRDFLLRHQHQQHGQARLSSITQHNSTGAPNPRTVPPAGAWKPVSYGIPRQHAQVPQPAQAFIPQRPPLPPRAPSAVAGNLATYPPALQEALEQCKRRSSSRPSSDTIYHIIYNLQSQYMDDKNDVVETYRSLQTANLKAAEHFVGNYLGLDVDEAEFTASEDGYLHCEIETDSSTGGLVSVHVEEGRLG